MARAMSDPADITIAGRAMATTTVATTTTVMTIVPTTLEPHVTNGGKNSGMSVASAANIVAGIATTATEFARAQGHPASRRGTLA